MLFFVYHYMFYPSPPHKNTSTAVETIHLLGIKTLERATANNQGMYGEKRNQFYGQRQKQNPTFTKTYISYRLDSIQENTLRQHLVQSDKQD
jgi:hypothetical protein